MAFGSEYGNVIKGIECPNCGAPAKVRGQRKEASRRIQTHIVCEKCHLVKFVGFTKPEHIAMDKLARTLEKRGEKAKTEPERDRIRRKQEDIEEKRRFKDLGL